MYLHDLDAFKVTDVNWTRSIGHPLFWIALRLRLWNNIYPSKKTRRVPKRPMRNLSSKVWRVAIQSSARMIRTMEPPMFLAYYVFLMLPPSRMSSPFVSEPCGYLYPGHNTLECTCPGWWGSYHAPGTEDCNAIHLIRFLHFTEGPRCVFKQEGITASSYVL